MIITEIIEEKNLVKHYSDNNKYILQVETGIEYDATYDVMPCRYTYEETDKDIPVNEFEKDNDYTLDE